MRSQILIVLLAATASARPIAQAESSSVDARELEYSEIEALYADRNRGQDKVETREIQYSDIEALYIERDRSKARHHHEESYGHPHEDVWPAHGPPPHHAGERPPFDHYHGEGEFDEFVHAQDHHHGGPRNDILDNIIGFFTHQVRRSVPDASSRVIDGIRDFLSHETRDVHEHDHGHLHPRHPYPGHDVGRHILDFFASAAK